MCRTLRPNRFKVLRNIVKYKLYAIFSKECPFIEIVSRKTTARTNRRVVIGRVKRSISSICRDSGVTKRNGVVRRSRIRLKGVGNYIQLLVTYNGFRTFSAETWHLLPAHHKKHMLPLRNVGRKGHLPKPPQEG
jgi:hypothetical protein